MRYAVILLPGCYANDGTGHPIISTHQSLEEALRQAKTDRLGVAVLETAETNGKEYEYATKIVYCPPCPARGRQGYPVPLSHRLQHVTAVAE